MTCPSSVGVIFLYIHHRCVRIQFIGIWVFAHLYIHILNRTITDCHRTCVFTFQQHIVKLKIINFSIWQIPPYNMTLTWYEVKSKVIAGWILSARAAAPTGQPELEGRSVGGRVLVDSAYRDHRLPLVLVLKDDRLVVLGEHGEVVVDVVEADDQRARACLGRDT